jgi:hypothetical protein
MQLPLKTPEVAVKLGITYHQAISLVRFRKIAPPQKDSSGDYSWTRADVDRARRAVQSARSRQGRNKQPA